MVNFQKIRWIADTDGLPNESARTIVNLDNRRFADVCREPLYVHIVPLGECYNVVWKEWRLQGTEGSCSGGGRNGEGRFGSVLHGRVSEDPHRSFADTVAANTKAALLIACAHLWKQVVIFYG